MSAPEQLVGCECRLCGHVWIVARLPIPMRALTKRMGGAVCPKCADTKPLLAKTAKLAALAKARGSNPKQAQPEE